jgi:hypothetical protein
MVERLVISLTFPDVQAHDLNPMAHRPSVVFIWKIVFKPDSRMGYWESRLIIGV